MITVLRGYPAALRAEVLKVRRSVVPRLTFLAVTLAGCVSGVFMFVVADPERARSMGLLNQKASLSGVTADWPGLLAFLGQLVAVGDLLLFAFIVTWVFGREAAEGTLRYLLVLPVPRPTVALAKFTVVAAWAAAANAWLAGVVLALGALLRLPGGAVDVVTHGLAVAAVAAALMLLVTTPIALVACAGRGYLAPLACALGMLIVAQVAAALGWGAVVPWSVPAVAAGLAPGTSLGVAGVLVAVLTGLAGVLSTIAWWRSPRAGA